MKLIGKAQDYRYGIKDLHLRLDKPTITDWEEMKKKKEKLKEKYLPVLSREIFNSILSR
jgi:hypothetical protein